MWDELLEVFPTVLTGTSVATAAALGISTACLGALKQTLLPKPKEAHLSDILPFSWLEDDGKTIVCKDGTRVRVISLKGLDYGTKTRDEKIAFLNKRHTWLDSLAKEGVEITVITSRQRTSLQDEGARPDFHNNDVLKEINQRWLKNFEDTFQNYHYVVLSHNVSQKKFRFGRTTKTELSHKRWDELTEAGLDYLSDYSPSLLRETFPPKTNYKAHETFHNEGLLAFWAKMINGFDHPIQSVKDHLSERMISSTIHFHPDTGIIESIDGAERFYSQIISVKQWNETIKGDLYDELYSILSEFRLIHWIKGQDKASASATLKYAHKQAKLLFYNHHVKEQYEQAVEWVDSGQSSLFEVQVSLILTCESKEELQERVQEVRRIFRNQNLKPAIETHAAEWLWFNQFPSFTQRVRSHKLFSQNVAALLPFSKDQQGIQNCDWGEGPLRTFKTSTGSTYAFQLHVSDKTEALAHSVVIAPSGSGKTTLFQHLIGGALRHENLKAYIFDRLRGTKIFTESIGGQFVDLGEEEGLSLNPLQCENNPTNRAFLARFLLQLAGTEDDASIQAVNRAVDTIFELPIEARVLSSIYEAVIDTGSPLKTLLRKWVGNTVQARWFNGQKDSLDISQNRLVSFEMAAVQHDSTAYAAMVTYIMHRIREQMQNKALPHLIFIDETAPMLQDPLFRSYVQELFREHRKLRGSINVCFQDASAITHCGIKETILTQCQTAFLFPNPNADKHSYMDLFNLTDDQWAFIKGESRNVPKRSVLVKRIAPENTEAVILDIDLSCLGNHLKFYRSGSESVQLMKQLQAQFGLEGWRQPYLEASS